jgi:acetyltransferase-like isoleucine patch superfamily enzyme
LIVMTRWLPRLRDEFGEFDVGLSLALALCRMLPRFAGNRIRTAAVRAVGIHLGRSTVIWGQITLTGKHVRRHLTIGEDCWFNAGVLIDASDEVTIGNRVSVGHDVLIMTSTHRIDSAWRRAGAIRLAPVRIGDGAWLAARCVIQPGVVIGEGAIVGAGAVVTRDVPPHTLVAGVPARPLRQLDHH